VGFRNPAACISTSRHRAGQHTAGIGVDKGLPGTPSEMPYSRGLWRCFVAGLLRYQHAFSLRGKTAFFSLTSRNVRINVHKRK